MTVDASQLPERPSLRYATLVIGVHRDGGLPQNPAIEFNGKRLEYKSEWATDIQHLFAPLEIQVPAKLVRGRKESERPIGSRVED